MTNEDRYLPLSAWPDPWPTQAGWRALIFNAKPRRTTKGSVQPNGLLECGAVRRVGRRVLVSPTKFYRWVEDQGVRHGS